MRRRCSAIDRDALRSLSALRNFSLSESRLILRPFGCSVRTHCLHSGAESRQWKRVFRSADNDTAESKRAADSGRFWNLLGTAAESEVYPAGPLWRIWIPAQLLFAPEPRAEFLRSKNGTNANHVLAKLTEYRCRYVNSPEWMQDVAE